MPRTLITIKCRQCGKEFKAWSNNRLHLCPACIKARASDYQKRRAKRLAAERKKDSVRTRAAKAEHAMALRQKIAELAEPHVPTIEEDTTWGPKWGFSSLGDRYPG